MTSHLLLRCNTVHAQNRSCYIFISNTQDSLKPVAFINKFVSGGSTEYSGCWFITTHASANRSLPFSSPPELFVCRLGIVTRPGSDHGQGQVLFLTATPLAPGLLPEKDHVLRLCGGGKCK